MDGLSLLLLARRQDRDIQAGANGTGFEKSFHFGKTFSFGRNPSGRGGPQTACCARSC